MKRTILSLILTLLAVSAWTQTLTGKVVAVYDGDTFTLLDDTKTQHKIRIYGIDAPEKAQAFGQKSRDHLAGLIFGKKVTVSETSEDRYGRTIGKVSVEGKDVSLDMISGGWAWHYDHFDSTEAYARAQREAKRQRLGLWADPNPVQPFEYRKNNK